MDLPRLSVVVRTYNSGVTLAPVLKGLDLEAGDELIIVDSGSTDQTLGIATQYRARILSIKKEDFTFGGSLNLGFRAATNPWILSLSSHCAPEHADLLQRYRVAAAKVGSDVTAMVGPIVGEFDNPIRAGHTYYSQGDLAHGFGFYAGNPNALYRRSTWINRPFAEPGGGEDFRWFFAALDAGETLVGVHAAEVRYISRRPAREFYKKGRIDYRVACELFTAHQPSWKGLAIRFIKVVVFWLIGRMSFPTAKGSLIHYIGTLVEARHLAKLKKTVT